VSPIGLPVIWYVVVYPDVFISTRDVYNGLGILTKGENEVKVREIFRTSLA
jgi:4-diphosphocytidyl-2C-methyl-D-erythritol kinase